MFLSWFWAGAVLCAAFFAFLTDSGTQTTSALLHGAAGAVEICIAMAGPLCLWAGLGKLMDRAGLTAALSKLLSPLPLRGRQEVRFFTVPEYGQKNTPEWMDRRSSQSRAFLCLYFFVWFLYLWLCVCQYWAASAPLSCSCSLSAIRAMNSELVGLPLVLDTV